MSRRVLLVEDDRELRSTWQAALALEGFAVRTAASLAEAQALWRHAGEALPELVILDLGLPDGEGEDFLAQVRRQGQVPVLIVSARQADAHKIRLLDAGADDYLVKPFSVGELLARMRVAWRHRGTTVNPAALHYRQGDVCIDLAQRLVTRAGEPVRLTPTEFGLLARLVRSAGQVVTHRQLLADVWGPEAVEQTQYLRLYMGQLRAKLEAQPSAPCWLLTEPGVGYRLADPADPAEPAEDEAAG